MLPRFLICEDEMKFGATLSFDFDAEDIHDEREHRDKLMAVLEKLKAEYADAKLEIRTRRTRTRPRAAPPAKLPAGFEIVRARYAG